MTNYGRSPWIDQFPKSRVPAFPKQRGPLKADVVVVGGGLTGCITAHAFAAAGVKKVVLVEAARIGHGSAGAASGWMADEPGISFVELEKAIGARGAKLAWQAWRRAALDCATLLRRLDIKCQLEARSTVTIAVSPDEIARLKREQQARRKAGIDAPLLTSPVVRAEAGLSGV